jgi:hypothetical protein
VLAGFGFEGEELKSRIVELGLAEQVRLPVASTPRVAHVC